MKNFLQTAFIALMVGGCSSLLSSCSDESEGQAVIDDSAPSMVTNISTTAGPGEVYLKWTIPSDPSFMYTKVVYKDAKGEETYRMFSKDHANEQGEVEATISGFVSTDPVEFSFFACSVRGNNKGAAKASGAPGAPAFLAVAESITAEPAWGGVLIGYTNETQAKVMVEVEYADAADASKKGSYKFEAYPHSENKAFVALQTSDDEFVNGGDANLTIVAQDADGNGSTPRSLKTRTKRVEKLDRTNWTFPGFADSYDPQIGYSSQEAGGEGAYPKGRVTAMLDGDEGTFWHTAWKKPSAYPHFFIIDMGEEKTVSNVTIRRRTNNNATNTGQTFYTCNTAEATGSSPDDWTWTNQGWYPFNRESNAHQLFGMATPASTRYIKVYFAESDKGGNFVMVSEFNAYTPAE